MAVSTFKLSSGTLVEILTTGLNSLSSTGRAISAAINNTDASPEAELELYIASFSGTPTANTCYLIYLLRQVDGTNYEDGDGSTTPARTPDAFFTVRASASAQRLATTVSLPPGTFKVLIVADTIGVAMAASGNTLKMKPFTGTGNT